MQDHHFLAKPQRRKKNKVLASTPDCSGLTWYNFNLRDSLLYGSKRVPFFQNHIVCMKSTTYRPKSYFRSKLHNILYIENNFVFRSRLRNVGIGEKCQFCRFVGFGIPRKSVLFILCPLGKKIESDWIVGQCFLFSLKATALYKDIHHTNRLND